MIVKQTDNGEYEIVSQNGTDRQMAGPFPTHAAAWRWIDRQEGEPISKAEAGKIHFHETVGGIA